MNLNELREAIEVVKTFYPHGFARTPLIADEKQALQTLITLTEDVIRIAGKMPEKKGMKFHQFAQYYSDGYNRARSDCIKAMAGKEKI